MGDYIGAMHEQQIADLRRDREELQARVAQLESTGQALLDAKHRDAGLMGPDTLAAFAELGAVLDGNATPTDRETDDDADT